MLIFSWNLHKMALAATILASHKPDVALFQEFWLHQNLDLGSGYGSFLAQSFDKKGSPSGTMIASRDHIDATKIVYSPHEESFVGIKKATAIGTVDGIQFASMHGYNGWPAKEIPYLIDHVRAVLSAMNDSGRAVFAGDFNTWTVDHRKAVIAVCQEFGFEYVAAAPLDKKKTFDMIFVRDMTCRNFKSGWDGSDHPWMEIECE